MRDLEFLSEMVAIGKKIYEAYFKQDQLENLDELKSLITQEEDLLNSIDISEETLFTMVLRLQYLRISLPVTNLLSGTSPTLNEYTYPYFRVLSHIEHKLNLFVNDEECYDKVYVNQEVALLYKLLKTRALNISESTEELDEYSKRILINSPDTEKELLNNNLNPHEMISLIYDYSRFQSLVSSLIIRLLNIVNFYKNLGFNDIYKKAEFQLSYNYLKTILLYIEPENRREMLENILTEQIVELNLVEVVPIFRVFIEPLLKETRSFEENSVRHLILLPKSRGDLLQ